MKIIMTKTIHFKDMYGNILHTLNKGDNIEYTAEVDNTYYVTSLGGIYKNEAQPIKEIDVFGWLPEEYLDVYTPPQSPYIKK